MLDAIELTSVSQFPTLPILVINRDMGESGRQVVGDGDEATQSALRW
jgi:hypothetical protein